MAVRIVGRKSPRLRQVVCPRCACRLEFLPEDVVEETLSEDRDGVRNTYRFIVCPVCGNQVASAYWETP